MTQDGRSPTYAMSNPCYISPFRTGARYRVTSSFGDRNNSFVEGEVVQFQNEAYDFHSGVVRNWFKSMDTGQILILEIWTDRMTPNWEDLKRFEELV